VVHIVLSGIVEWLEDKLFHIELDEVLCKKSKEKNGCGLKGYKDDN